MNPKPWYKSPVAYIAGAVILVGFVGSLSASSTAPQTANTAAATNAVQTVQTQQPDTQQTTAVESSSTTLSNENYYTNVDGNTVHSPAYTSDNSVPAGATAECGDGTYSFSQHRSGTCSHHGGVLQWF